MSIIKKIKKVDYYISGKIEKHGCLLGDLVLRVYYESSGRETSEIINYSFQFSKEVTEYGHRTFGLKNESKESYVFDNMGSWPLRDITTLLEKKIKVWCERNRLICQNAKGDTELFLSFLDNSFKLTQVYKRETLFENWN